MEKIKNCLMEEQPGYNFQVELDGKVIAECKMPTTLDLEKINAQKTDFEKAFTMVECCVTEWAFAHNDEYIDITVDNIDRLDTKYKTALLTQVTKKVTEWNVNKAAISKNLK